MEDKVFLTITLLYDSNLEIEDKRANEPREKDEIISPKGTQDFSSVIYKEPHQKHLKSNRNQGRNKSMGLVRMDDQRDCRVKQ